MTLVVKMLNVKPWLTDQFVDVQMNGQVILTPNVTNVGSNMIIK